MNKAEYAEYLNGPEWKALRDRKIAKGMRKTCTACLRYKPLQLHHMIYRDSPELTSLKDLLWLCADCHKLFHQMHGLLVPAEIRAKGRASIKAYTKRVMRHAAWKADIWPQKEPPRLKYTAIDQLVREKVYRVCL